MIVGLEGERYVTDPCSGHVVKVPLPLDHPHRVDVCGGSDAGRTYHYAVEPLGGGYFELHNLGPDADPDRPDPQRGQMYIFHEAPVPDDAFEDYMRWAYHEGHGSTHLSFVCRHPTTNVVHRFSTHSWRLWRLWRSVRGPWEEVPLGDDPARTLAVASRLPYRHLTEALDYLKTLEEETL